MNLLHDLNGAALILPSVAALFILTLEPLLLAKRMHLFLAPGHKVSYFPLFKIYFRAQFISHFSASAIGDLFRLKKLGDYGTPPPSLSDRIQFLALERATESASLPLISLCLVGPATVLPLLPKVSPNLLIAIGMVLLGLFFFARSKSGSTPRFRLASIPLRTLVWVSLLSASGWALDLLALRFLTWHEAISWGPLMLSLLAVSFASLPPLPWGRWGLFEGLLAGTLSRFGVPFERALALSILFHVLTVLPIASVVLGLWIRRRILARGRPG